MAIRFYNEECGYRLKGKRRLAAWIKECAAAEGRSVGEVAFIFCSPERHRAINLQYLGHDYNTDVITFEYEDAKGGRSLSGDIFIDPATVSENARLFGAGREEEMHRVMIHGIMHLCGYGDGTQEEKKTMRAKEDACLALLKE